MTLIGYVFSKLETAKRMVGQMSKTPRFRTPFNSQRVQQSEKLHERAFIILFHHFGKN